jgi:hypothetical protein
MPNAKSSRKPNGHANSSPHGALAVHREYAASDDATGPFVAIAAASPIAAGANRNAYAEAAQAAASGEKGVSPGAAGPRSVSPRPNGADHSQPSEKDTPAKDDANRFKDIPPGDETLPVNGPEFVEAVHTRMDLITLQVELLRSRDEKVVQRELDCLRELRYGKTDSSGLNNNPATPAQVTTEPQKSSDAPDAT